MIPDTFYIISVEDGDCTNLYAATTEEEAIEIAARYQIWQMTKTTYKYWEPKEMCIEVRKRLVPRFNDEQDG